MHFRDLLLLVLGLILLQSFDGFSFSKMRKLPLANAKQNTISAFRGNCQMTTKDNVDTSDFVQDTRRHLVKPKVEESFRSRIEYLIKSLDHIIDLFQDIKNTDLNPQESALIAKGIQAGLDFKQGLIIDAQVQQEYITLLTEAYVARPGASSDSPSADIKLIFGFLSNDPQYDNVNNSASSPELIKFLDEAAGSVEFIKFFVSRFAYLDPFQSPQIKEDGFYPLMKLIAQKEYPLVHSRSYLLDFIPSKSLPKLDKKANQRLKKGRRFLESLERPGITKKDKERLIRNYWPDNLFGFFKHQGMLIILDLIEIKGESSTDPWNYTKYIITGEYYQWLHRFITEDNKDFAEIRKRIASIIRAK
jgi:hypothetical protein